MKLFRAHGGAIALAFAVLTAPAVALAQSCNTSTPACGGAPACAGGCGASVSVYHPSVSPCGSATPQANFDFTATEFANNCLTGTGGCVIGAPPIRFWQYDAYKKANSGCFDPIAASALANAAPDFGIGATPGHWFLYQGNWQNGSQGDGCIAGANGELRTVVEFSFPVTASENTINHNSLYLVASVPLTSDYDFDTIRGGSGCAQGVINPVPVPALTVTGSTGPCTGNTVVTTGTDNTANPSGFFDIPVTLTNGSPDYYDEVGKSTAGKRLIAGYQVLYAGGTTADGSSEPRSSVATTGGWNPTLDPANPTNIHAVVPYGTTSTTVSIPKAACGTNGCWFWLATRIVYQDASMNPTGSVPLAGGPLVVSDVSAHCGPVSFGAPPPAVSYKSVTAERTNGGIRISWETFKEDDTLGFQVVRATGANGNENVEALPSQIEARGAYYPYELLDHAVASNLTTTYTYYVQEITTSGALGDRSQSVSVPAAVISEPSTTGGRSRGKARR